MKNDCNAAENSRGTDLFFWLIVLFTVGAIVHAITNSAPGENKVHERKIERAVREFFDDPSRSEMTVLAIRYSSDGAEVDFEDDSSGKQYTWVLTVNLQGTVISASQRREVQ